MSVITLESVLGISDESTWCLSWWVEYLLCVHALLFGCGVLGRDRIIYCIGHNVRLLLLALSSLPVVSSCRFFG